MKNKLEILINNLDENHKKVLRWFNDNKNKIIDK